MVRRRKDRGAGMNEVFEAIVVRFDQIRSVLDERARRWWAGSEALRVGRGGVMVVSDATGLSRDTVAAGMWEVRRQATAQPLNGCIRRAGGGRKRAEEKQPGLEDAVESLAEPTARGDPMSPLRWTTRSLRHMSAALKTKGFDAGPHVVARVLESLEYSLQANRKTQEGTSHRDRNAQFEHIAAQSREFLQEGQPVISVDTKKKELVGRYKNAGREVRPKGEPEPVSVHDFEDPTLGKGIPYGVYDTGRNVGWVSVGVDHDTAAFAVRTIQTWWERMGSSTYPNAQRLLITADAGGSNGYRRRTWKHELQRLADDLKIDVSVCHLPPGTSKWNKIEHRLFSQITLNWRGRPLESLAVMVSAIAATTTTTGLRVQAAIDPGVYPTGVQVTNEQVAALNIEPASFHGEWNYTIKPRQATASSAEKKEC